MKLSTVLLSVLAGVYAAPRNFTTVEATGTFNPAAATAVQTEYPKDHHIVRGRRYDHIWTIVLDSADYEDAANNEDLQALLTKYGGLKLTNYYAVGQPAQANLLAMVGGDTFGLDSERFVALPENVSTIAESLENQKVLWASYAEGQPFTAFTGWEYEPANYSRAFNPFVSYDSVTSNRKRYVNLRSLETLYQDYAKHRYPQWLLITPNTYNNGRNSDLATSAKWTRDFLEPFFNASIAEEKNLKGVTDIRHRHLFIVTFASAKSTDGPNRVLTLLLGDMPDGAHNDPAGQNEDDSYYDHYSILASTEANYDLPHLGRYDTSANVFKVINSKAHITNEEEYYKLRLENLTDTNYNNFPASGYLGNTDIQLPVPNLQPEGPGRAGVVSRVKKLWNKASYSYSDWEVNY